MFYLELAKARGFNAGYALMMNFTIDPQVHKDATMRDCESKARHHNETFKKEEALAIYRSTRDYWKNKTSSATANAGSRASPMEKSSYHHRPLGYR